MGIFENDMGIFENDMGILKYRCARNR